MAKKKSRKGRYNFLVDTTIYEEFSRLCEELGYVRGKQVELAMHDFILKHRKEYKGPKKE